MYTVRTNRKGGEKDRWKGKVAYRMEDINKAYKIGSDLECLCTDEHPKRMIISNADIYKNIKYRKTFNGTDKWGSYELAYFDWLPNFEGNIPIKQLEQLKLL